MLAVLWPMRCQSIDLNTQDCCGPASPAGAAIHGTARPVGLDTTDVATLCRRSSRQCMARMRWIRCVVAAPTSFRRKASGGIKPLHESSLSQIFVEPRGSGKVLPRRMAGLSCRRQKIRFARLASGRLRKSDAHPGAANGVCAGSARHFPAHSWRLGKDGTHPHSPGRRKPGYTHRCASNGMETPK